MLTRLRLWLLSPPACRDESVLRRAVQGQTIVITGASDGIGQATALLLAQAGARVVLLARSEAKLLEVCSMIRQGGGQAAFYPLDLAKPEQISAVVAQLQAEHPRIDAVISNAGKSIRRPALAGVGKRDLERQLAVNFTGPAALISALVPRMLEQGGGVVVNVSSVSVKPPAAPRWGAYQGSKAGFDLWVQALGAEGRSQGLRVASVYLPLTRTRMIAPTRAYRFLPALTPPEAAQAVVYPLVRRAARVAPWWLVVQEGLALVFPAGLAGVLALLERLEQRLERWRARD